MSNLTAQFKLVYQMDGTFIGVEPPGQPLVPEKDFPSIDDSRKMWPLDNDYQTTESIDFIHWPGTSVCCIVVHGKRYCWC
jgi:hypothetical protein